MIFYAGGEGYDSMGWIFFTLEGDSDFMEDPPLYDASFI